MREERFQLRQSLATDGADRADIQTKIDKIDEVIRKRGDKIDEYIDLLQFHSGFAAIGRRSRGDEDDKDQDRVPTDPQDFPALRRGSTVNAKTHTAITDR